MTCFILAIIQKLDNTLMRMKPLKPILMVLNIIISMCFFMTVTMPVEAEEDTHADLGYKKVALTEKEKDNLANLLQPFLDEKEDIIVYFCKSSDTDDGAFSWLYSASMNDKFVEIGTVNSKDINFLLSSKYRFSSEVDTLDYFMFFKLSTIKYEITVVISPVLYDNIYISSNDTSVYVFSKDFHDILTAFLENRFGYSSRK